MGEGWDGDFVVVGAVGASAEVAGAVVAGAVVEGEVVAGAVVADAVVAGAGAIVRRKGRVDVQEGT